MPYKPKYLLQKKLLTKFPGIKTLMIYNASMKELSRGDFNSTRNSLGNYVFQGAEKLTEIELESNQIEKVFINAFHGLSLPSY